MSDLDEATENPNDKSPPGKPLDPKVIVPETTPAATRLSVAEMTNWMIQPRAV